MTIEDVAKVIFYFERNFTDVGEFLPEDLDELIYIDKKIYLDIAEEYLASIKVEEEQNADNT